jgi:hemoglobin-like flavoprotein
MNKDQESKLDMYNAVLNYCNANSVIVATVPAFQSAIKDFQNITDQVYATAQLQTSVITGIATDKTQMRKALCQQAADLAAAVFAYAVSADNNELKAQVSFPISILVRIKAGAIAATCSNISGAATANLAALNTYGITAASLADFNTAIDNYVAKIAMPRNAVSQRAHYNSLLKDLFKQGNAILKNEADKVVNQFKTTYPEFYAVYKNNRIIVDPGSSPTQITGTVTDSATSLPVEGSTAEIAGEAITATTDASGVFLLKTTTPGIVSVKISKAGYTDKTITGITVKLGKTTTADVQLKAV